MHDIHQIMQCDLFLSNLILKKKNISVSIDI